MHPIDLVETAYDEDGNTVAHIEAWGPTDDVTMQTVAANGKEVVLITTDETPETFSTVKAAILDRISNGQTPYVLPEHLETLGLTGAVYAWATNA